MFFIIFIQFTESTVNLDISFVYVVAHAQMLIQARAGERIVQRVMVMLQWNIQSRAEIVEPVAPECRFGDMLSGCLQRADIFPVLGVEVFPQQCFSNHRQIEQRVVRHE